MRWFWVLAHRYVGLVMAGFLLIAGLTGALLAWYHELDAALNPHLFRVQAPHSAAAPLDALTLRESVLARYPGAVIDYVSLRRTQGEAAVFYLEGALDSASGEPLQLANDEVFVDPYSGRGLGERKWGDITQGLTNLMPFIYRLHYSLALGTFGSYLFGIVALVWTLDCFIGAYLTFPARRRGPRTEHAAAAAARGWWARWGVSWKVRWRAGTYKLNFDLHRAGGLWPWAMLFVLAWSSVAFNLQEVYHPVMRALFGMQIDARTAVPSVGEPQAKLVMGWQRALEVGREHASALAREKGFSVLAEDSLSYDPAKNMVRLRVKSDRDIGDKYGATSVYFHSSTGVLLGSYVPTGEAVGDTVTSWLLTLHMAQIWGVPFKLFVTVVGVVLAVLCATGVYIWWRKHRSRRQIARRSVAAAAQGVVASF